ncbi:DoxX family protein [Lunatimonas sp.]|uniref:DoxX family protein n=1 Tax=Lunatimonas sp. TaxID=2060141 RepID=UPI00344FDF52
MIKEWAYAGFFFLMSGAVFSHLANQDPWSDYFGPVLLLVLISVSWSFRPDDRKLVAS